MSKIQLLKNSSLIKKNLREYVSTRGICIGQSMFNKNRSEGPKSATPSDTVNLSNVTGLTEACLKEGSKPVMEGTSKDGEYKNTEYFGYNTMSYFEAEIEMSKFRCPQPSAVKTE